MKNNQSGLIILVTLWVMAILTVFALGIGYRASLEIRLVRYQTDKLKTLYIAKAAVSHVKELINIDLNSESKDYDALYLCGIYLPSGQTPEAMFKDIIVGEGSYTIKYKIAQSEGNQPVYNYGLSDEERKININTAERNTLEILFELLTVEPLQAESIAASIVDWRDDNNQVTPSGAENSYYQSLENPYDCKNANFENLEELLLVRNITPSIFNKIKGYLTVYGEGKVNINTASQIVLQALASCAGYSQNITDLDSASVANKIIDSRNGDDNIEGTSDDTPCRDNLTGYLTDIVDIDSRIIGSFSNLVTIKSANFRAEIQAKSSDSKVVKKITVILDNAGAIKSWQEE